MKTSLTKVPPKLTPERIQFLKTQMARREEERRRLAEGGKTKPDRLDEYLVFCKDSIKSRLWTVLMHLKCDFYHVQVSYANSLSYSLNKIESSHGILFQDIRVMIAGVLHPHDFLRKKRHLNFPEENIPEYLISELWKYYETIAQIEPTQDAVKIGVEALALFIWVNKVCESIDGLFYYPGGL